MAIKDSIFIKTKSLLKELTHEKGGNAWYLSFDNDVAFSLYTMWRLFKNDSVLLISNDHQHQFGLPKPEDLVSDLKEIISDNLLKEIQIERNTGDLILIFDKNVKLVAYISSMGYESYEVFVNGNQYVAQGGGDIAIFELKKYHR